MIYWFSYASTTCDSEDKGGIGDCLFHAVPKNSYVCYTYIDHNRKEKRNFTFNTKLRVGTYFFKIMCITGFKYDIYYKFFNILTF